MTEIVVRVTNVLPADKDRAEGARYLQDSRRRTSTVRQMARMDFARQVLTELAAEDEAPDYIGEAAAMLCDRVCEMQHDLDAAE